MTVDESFMRRALDLAERGRYSVSPNPMVGAVIVRDGRIIGEGWHERAGEPHAEVAAIRSATERLEGSTIHVTLEPCCHQGRTPPCTDALVEAGIASVVIAASDPSPHASGRGIEILRAAGIEVVEGVLRDEAERLNEIHLHSASHLTPFVLIKAGITLDGKLGTIHGKSKWITSDESRERSLALREEYDAILVGAGTVIADNPRLDRRLGWNRSIQPWIRVVVDASGEIAPDATVLSDGHTTLVCSSRGERYRKAGSVEVLEYPERDDLLDLREVLRTLRERGIRSVLVEGGSMILTSMIRERLWQKMQLFIAPKILGGATAPSIFGGDGVGELSEAYHLRFDAVERVGPDLLVTAYPED
jgi:diaminohydroxyphosphoribosylaminopyrimidine deaminase / 5-amino-6-(5-phosphoribosylamino)uracil reductase